ncbi:GDP-mannose 4,6-dehydratase [Nakamurella lactea]|uniref:GDP-mannose 4,6-dehydratase n=1 Tax=Nakamurella lactea TaxID=459515 RepID=UPI000408A2B1|nr:GDP-mannose 4,6-dehydratase [Nakamurella lactea]
MTHGTERVLITGITGQDGGYLAEQLSNDGAEIHGLVRDGDEAASGLLQRLPQAQLHTGDLTDTEGMRDLLRVLKPSEVYNLAGISSVAQSWEQPTLTAEVTGVAVAVLLQTAWQLTESGNPVRFVQASSAEMFGNPQRSPQNESTPIAPVSPYGAAKAYAHHLVGVYRARGLHACSLILYNHESPRRPSSFVTRKITQAAARIAGGDTEQLALGNLDARRDWGWAPDYVDAMVRAARHAVPGDYVIATGVEHTVRDFVAAAFVAAGIDDWNQYVRVDPRFFRPVDAVEQIGDPSKAGQLLGWAPTVPFDEIVARMVRAENQPAE